MTCAWKELLGILPMWIRGEVDKHGKQTLQELRLRINAPPEMILMGESYRIPGKVNKDDLNFCVNTASKYSPWTASTVAKGYLTAPGGHRIGLCGEVVCMEGKPHGIREITSLCIRVARDYPGISEKAAGITGSVLIIGAPGWGKTTLLRDFSRKIARAETICVVDERGELFPSGIPRGEHMDTLSGCPKTAGIDMLLRTMGPSYIAVDEITAEEDCKALIQAANCGVSLLAAAHASSVQDLYSRSIYRPLIDQNIFKTILVLSRDKSYKVERMK